MSLSTFPEGSRARFSRRGRHLASLFLALLAVVALTGCSLPGLSDRTARYALRPSSPADLALHVRMRLAVYHLGADVRREGDDLTIRATADHLPHAVRALSLPAGLEMYTFPEGCGTSCEGPEVRDDTSLSPAPNEGALVRPVGHGAVRVVRVALPSRVVPASELTIRRVGPTLVVSAKEGTNAAKLLVADTPVVLGIGRTAVYVGAPKSTIELTLGGDLEAYEHARTLEDLLATPELGLPPPTIEPAPRDLLLTGFTLLLPLVLSIIYVGFVRRFDRAHPEPLGLVAITFVLGALSAELAGLAEWGFMKLSPWTNPQLLTFGGQAKALPLSTLGFALLVGVPEEGAKLLATVYATRRREFDEPVDGVVYGVVAALGFAAAENIVYFASGRVSATLVVGRAFTAIPVHVFLSGLWGYALGAKLVDKKYRILPWFLAAALLHGGYDAAMSTDSGFAIGLLVVLALAVSFIGVLRAALRHGPVSEATVLAARAERKVHAFGRRPVFPALALALPVLAAALLVVSAGWESTGATMRSPFTGPMILLVIVIGAVLWGLTSTLPLDAVVDRHGVTFAGAVRAFPDIDTTHVAGEYLEIASPRGDIEIGPGAREELETLAREIQDGRASSQGH